MGWIYLAESGDSVSHLASGSEYSLTVNETPTHREFCFLECPRENWTEPQSAPTSATFTHIIYGHRSTSYMADFPAKTLALQDLEQAWTESEVGFIGSSTDLFAKQVLGLYFSKTSQQLELEGLAPSRNHLPSSGMICAGRLYQPKKLALRTCVNDGSCLPTPTACEAGSNRGGGSGRVGKFRPSLSQVARKNLWPTPRASPNENRQTKPTPSQLAGKHGMNLSTAVHMWPTPTIAGNYNRPGASKHSGMGLASAVKTSDGGQLNPTWVEWLMGYPIEWTALEDWAMQWFRSRRKQHSKG